MIVRGGVEGRAGVKVERRGGLVVVLRSGLKVDPGRIGTVGRVDLDLPARDDGMRSVEPEDRELSPPEIPDRVVRKREEEENERVDRPRPLEKERVERLRPLEKERVERLWPPERREPPDRTDRPECEEAWLRAERAERPPGSLEPRRPPAKENSSGASSAAANRTAIRGILRRGTTEDSEWVDMGLPPSG